jgi:hypothetical protein
MEVVSSLGKRASLLQTGVRSFKHVFNIGPGEKLFCLALFAFAFFNEISFRTSSAL